jgi:hypothetical protein
MSNESYFRKFPVINYSNVAVLDITRRAIIPEKYRRDRFSYYPYTLQEGERVDHVADSYYNDPYFDWLVWTASGIVDPYYDWYLDTETFEAYLVEKYGSIPEAQELILWWQVDWADSEEEITPAAHAALPDALRKYYQANYGQGTRVISYKRGKDDWMTTTNMIVRFDVGNSSSNVASLTVGENVKLREGNTDHANAVVVWSNSSVVKVQHVFGNVAAENSRLVGVDSTANLSVDQRYYESNCIPVDERVYWLPVYAYEYEMGLNEQNKVIKMIDTRYKIEISDAMTKKLSGNTR